MRAVRLGVELLEAPPEVLDVLLVALAGLAADLGSMKCSACSCVKMTSVLLLESSSEAAMDLTVAHSRLPFASSSRMTRFFESRSWMRMTFSCPFTMK